jgi:hypothetical protein
MNILFVLGLLIVLVTIIDIVWTTLWVDGGAGVITNKTCTLLWILMVKMNRGNDGILKFSGPIILIAILVNWIILLWIGWTLIFSGSFESITNTVNNNPIEWKNFIYYSGYSIFTLGSGDYAPTSPLWQILTTIASGTGTLFFTLGASYIISIVGAVADKRSFASSILGIGSSPEEIVIESRNGKNVSSIDLLLMNLSDNLSALSVKHKAYPLLHYYHTNKKQQASAIALPIIDDALSIMEFGLEKEAKPNPILLKKFRNCIDDYLNTLQKTYINASEKPLMLPDLSMLRRANIPVVEDKIFELNMIEIEDRRKKLLGLLTKDNWDEDDLKSV